MCNILIVDDDFWSLEGLKQGVRFQEIGFQNVYFSTGIKSACDIITHHQIDILVSDIEMPGGSGLELQKWLLEQGYSPVTLFLTCHANFEYAQEAVRLRIFDYVLKPIRYEEFEQKLVCAVNEYKKRNKETDPDTPVEADEPDKSIIQQIKQYIDDHISEEITREQIGRAFYLSSDYVARIFKNEEGASLTNYIRSRRIEIAKKLLMDTNRSIADISQSVGYSYNTYFFNTFKSIVGVSPHQYRKRIK